jgi:hypothetical protein
MSVELWERVENPSRYHDYHWSSDNVPVRKHYLFLAEIGRRLRHLMTDPDPIKMIEFCKQCAEGQITEYELSHLSEKHRVQPPGLSYAAESADHLYWWVADRYKVNTRGFYHAVKAFAAQAAVEEGLLSPEGDDNYEHFQAVMMLPKFAAIIDRTELEWGEVVRDIHGPNPFQPYEFAPTWRTSTAQGIAHRIYDDNAFEGMPVLADALEDAGCDDVGVLAHCRGPGPHVRGCWVVDLVLNKG